MIILSKKQNLIIGIVAIVFAIGLFIGAFCLVYFHDIGEIQSKEFTFDYWTNLPSGKNRILGIYVKEEPEPLAIFSITIRYLDKTTLDTLSKGDRLQCKVVDSSKYAYEIVELCADGQCLLSLENSIKAYRGNSITGCCVTGGFGILFVILAGMLLYRSKHGYSEKYKNAQKQRLKTVLSQNREFSPKETELLLKAIDSADLSDDLPCGKQELTDKFTSSFYTQNNREYTTAMQYLTNQGCCKVFRETLSEILSDGELRVCYDAGDTENGSIFVLYKTNGKIIDGYLLKNDETGKFEIDELNMSSEIYGKVKLNKTEKRQFIEKLQEYNRLKEDIFDIAAELFI